MRSNRNGEVSTFQDASGLYYSDNSNTSSDNICRVIVNAINSEEPARFVSAENGLLNRIKIVIVKQFRL
jgi:hypothetical protein